MGYSKYRPAQWKVIGKKQLGQSCALCHEPFWLCDLYYVDAHLDCVIKHRRSAAAEKRRT
jgi:hypothetical protein